MRKDRFIWGIVVLILALVTNMAYGNGADVPREPTNVYIKGKQLMVRKCLMDGSLDGHRPYIIKGVTWQPATRAPSDGTNPLNPYETIEYGFFFDYEGRVPQGHEILNFWLKNQFQEHYQTDIPLMKKMNINTVRVYIDFGCDPDVYNRILDEFYRNGIMVILTAAISRDDLESSRYLEIVQQYKDHPAILMWSLGNEWNFNKYYGYNTAAEAAEATNQAAYEIKAIDMNHPVSSCLGDNFKNLWLKKL